MGSIRAGGEKPDKGAGAKLHTWRFTSPSKVALEKLAAIYGGTVTRWDARKQWQLYSESSEICVILDDRFALQESYSLFDGRIETRKCDGDECIFKKVKRNGKTVEGVDDPVTVPCMCAESTERSCDLSTIIRVIVPATEDITLWWIRSKGVIANSEINGILSWIRANTPEGQPTQAYCTLTLAWEENSTGTNKWVVPRFSLDTNPPNFPAMLLARTPYAQAQALQASNSGAAALGGRTDAPALETRTAGQRVAGTGDPEKDKAVEILRARGWLDPSLKDIMDGIKTNCKAKNRPWVAVVIEAEEKEMLTDKIFSLEAYAHSLSELVE